MLPFNPYPTQDIKHSQQPRKFPLAFHSALSQEINTVLIFIYGLFCFPYDGNYIIWTFFLSYFFHPMQFFRDPCCTKSLFLLFLGNISLYGYGIFSLFLLLIMNIWVVSTFWPFKMKHFIHFFFLNGCTCCIWKFPGHGSNWSCSCGLYHSHRNTRYEPYLRPKQQLVAMLDPNPLSKARDQTHILTETISGPSPTEPQWKLLLCTFFKHYFVWMYVFISLQ